jgi:hypothetical protein
MLIDDRHRILQELRRAVAVFFSVLVLRELLLVMQQLAEQALPKGAAANTRRIELTNHFKRFGKIASGKC